MAKGQVRNDTTIFAYVYHNAEKKHTCCYKRQSFCSNVRLFCYFYQIHSRADYFTKSHGRVYAITHVFALYVLSNVLSISMDSMFIEGTCFKS